MQVSIYRKPLEGGSRPTRSMCILGQNNSSERGEWGDCVALHFGFLTLQAGTGPSAYAWPNIVGSHQVLSGSNDKE